MRTLPTLFAIPLALAASAQCNVSIPSTATVITANGLVSANSESFWVCNGVAVTFSGNGNTIYSESGAIVALTGMNNTLIAKGFGSAGGSSNTVWAENSATIVDQGTNNTINDCNPVVFNYTNAPSNGCAVGIEENTLSGVSIYPTTSTDGRITVETKGAWLDQVLVMNALGQQVMAVPGKGLTVIDMSALGNGVYFLRLTADGQERVQRITLR
ncbi:MAG: T9SS type A sorting domain-containing protein [Flavobacteriales bacterium]|nr:MAG: T9SS type A sorting domain-containing protein [Flavobacteriales bacterium]